MIKLSLLVMIGLTVLFAIGLRWREEQAPTPRPAGGFVAAQKRKLNRWVTAAALGAVATMVILGGINWLRIWQNP